MDLIQKPDFGKIAYEETHQLNRKLANLSAEYFPNTVTFKKSNCEITDGYVAHNINFNTNHKELINLGLTIKANNLQFYSVALVLNGATIKKFKIYDNVSNLSCHFFAYEKSNVQIKVESELGFNISEIVLTLSGKFSTKTISYDNIAMDYHNLNKQIKLLLKHNNNYYLHSYDNCNELVNSFSTQLPESETIFENVVTFMFNKNNLHANDQLFLLKQNQNNVVLENDDQSKSVVAFNEVLGSSTFCTIAHEQMRFMVYRVFGNTLTFKGYDNDLQLLTSGELLINFRHKIKKLVPVINKETSDSPYTQFFAITSRNEIYMFSCNYDNLRKLTLVSQPIFISNGSDIYANLNNEVLTIFVLKESSVFKSQYTYYINNRTFKRIKTTEILNAKLGFAINDEMFYLYDTQLDKEQLNES